MTQTSTCRWCGSALEPGGRGRPAEFCSAAHRQRAYEARRVAEGRGRLRPPGIGALRDAYEAACAALPDPWRALEALAEPIAEALGRPAGELSPGHAPGDYEEG